MNISEAMTIFDRYYLKLVKDKADKRIKKYNTLKRYWKRYNKKYKDVKV